MPAGRARLECEELLRIESENPSALLNLPSMVDKPEKAVMPFTMLNTPPLPACVNQHVSIVRANPSFVDPDYLVAYLAHPSTKGYIESFNAGGSRRAITKGHIESFQLPLPPLNEQRQIGAMLRTIDRKIELNRRMNETLGAIAREIFQSWFVSFDPVRAKAAGRDPDLPKDISDLFPDSFQQSELGDIPLGWLIVSLITVGQTSRFCPTNFWKKFGDCLKRI